ncbi:Ribosomal RNA small subunit methyltransferase I [BD1-7 clade bacterium]|uniref:Ribosomal RNA small subunit methyltransferase I n=1 Tax=BD1-7 clade bacterium TaxID=2029982 RepID=A0A5S9N428_9GAMM|nr:Ribosomal RNA small subunit methyltransferase I [BD1-7 clade bacterium]
MSSVLPSVLYIVATPIGNMADMTPRAKEILANADIIAAEDTRHSAYLMRHFDIRTPMLAYHEHAGESQTRKLLELLEEGKSLALISDAGTPLISDPGYPLVAEAHARGIKVCPVPGVSAIITALCAAGLPTHTFAFEGFLPAKAAARQKALALVAEEKRTLVFYEAPHRIVECLSDMCEAFGHSRRVTLARELTKTFETIRQNSLAELLEWVRNDDNQQKGEIVLVVEGVEYVAQSTLSDDARSLAALLVDVLPPKKASKIVASHYDLPTRDVYDFLLGLKN